jgi:hypothetical protein
VTATGLWAIELAQRDGDRNRFIPAGDVDATDWLGAYEAFAQSEPGGHVLLELTGATLTGLSAADVRDLARRVDEVRRRQQQVGRIALVCAEDAEFGIARMLVAYAECGDHADSMRVFRDSDSAWRWLLNADE